MPSPFSGGDIPQLVETASTPAQYDIITVFVLTYINWIMLGVSLFVILYCAKKYYYEKRKERGTD